MTRFSIEENDMLHFRDTLSYSSSASSCTEEDYDDSSIPGADAEKDHPLKFLRQQNYNDGTDDESQEPEHPLGFGITRFGIYTRSPASTPSTSSSFSSDYHDGRLDHVSLVQFFQWPLTSVSISTTGTRHTPRLQRTIQKTLSSNPQETEILFKHHQRRQMQNSSSKGGDFETNAAEEKDLVHRMNRIAMLVKAASVSSSSPSTTSSQQYLAIPSESDADTAVGGSVDSSGGCNLKFQSLLKAAQDYRQRESQIKVEMERYRNYLFEKQKRDAETLLSIIKREQAEAERILYLEQQQEEKVMEEQRMQRERILEKERQDNERIERERKTIGARKERKAS
jgi:hypothetical protein